MRKIIKIVLLGLFILFFAHPSFAELPASLRVYTAHGEIDTIHQAFTKLALIVSDARYIGVCYALLVLSFLVTAYHVFGGKGIIGQMGPSDMLSWIFSFLVACVLLRAFIIPTTDVTIDDVTMGQTMTVADVPDGIVLLVNGMNIMENALLEIVNTSNTPDSFINNPGGAGFNIISKMFDKQIDLSGTPGGTDMAINIQNYIGDCLAPALNNNTNGLNIDELMNTNNYIPAFAKAANPAVFTSMSNGSTVTCNFSYTTIATYFSGLTDTSPGVQKWATRFCSEAGWFDKIMVFVGIPKLTTCWNNATNFIGNSIIGTPVTLPQIFRQKLIAEELYKFATSGDLNAGVIGSGNYHQGNAMVSAGLLSAEWMPQIKNMMLAAFLGMSPFLLIFLATTIWKKVLGFMFGCLTFFTVWGICDAVMHDFAMAKAIEVMRGVAQGQLGMKSIIMFSSESMKAYAVFGQYKVWSMGLAVFFSGALVKGGSELGRIAAGRASDMKSVGDAASADMTDPVRNASKREGLASAVPTQALYNSNAYDAMSSVAEYNKKAGVYGAREVMKNIGGPGHSSEIAAQNAAYGIAYNVEKPMADAKATDIIAKTQSMDRETLMGRNAVASIASQTGTANALFERGGTPEGVADLAERLANFNTGKGLSELGAYEKYAKDTGKTTDGLLDLVKGKEAAQAVSDGIEFNASAARHNMTPLEFGRLLSNVSNEMAHGNSKAMKEFASKHYGGGEGAISAATKDVATFDRLKKLADMQAHKAIAQKHFKGDQEKMFAAMAMASVAAASGDAVARQHVADNYFHGDQFDMDRAASLYKNTSEAAKNKALGKGLESVAAGGGKHAAGKAMGEKKVVDTVGTGGVASTGAASEYGKQAGSIWNSLVESMVNGRAMPRGMRQTLKDMMANPHSREQLNANGKGISVAMPNDKRKAIEFGKKIGMSEADAASMAGSQITVSGGVDEKGRLYFTTKDSQKGDSVSTYTNRKNEAAGVLEAFRSGSYANLNPYSERLITASMNQADRTLDGKGGAALSREVRAIASQLTDEIQKSGYSRTGSREGSLNASASADVGLRVPGIGGGGVGLDYRDGSSDRETYNLVATDIQRNIRRAVNESGNNTDALSRNLDKYVGSFIRETLGETQSKKPTDFGGETIIDSGAGDIEKFKRDLKR